MHAVVCIKQVPDTQEVKINFDAGVIVRDGVPLIVNPFDEYAVEEGLRLKEKHGGTVTAVTMGPPAADEALRTALAMGCDAAVLLADAAFALSDTWATAVILAKAIAKLAPYDLIVFGKQTFDGDAGVVGPRVAVLLGLPMLSFVAKIEAVDFAAKKITVERLLENGRETVTAPLPACLALVKEINEPRYPSLMGMRKARKIAVPTWDAAALGISPDAAGAAGSFLTVDKISPPPTRAGGEVLECEAPEAARKIAARLTEQGLI